MTISLTPLPSRVSAKSVLPNTDPATGIITTTGRPTRHDWAVGQTILADMGVRLDIAGAGRNHGEDLELLAAWLTAHQATMLVVRHATNLHSHELLDNLALLCEGVGVHLALTCDDTVGHTLVDWVGERSGVIDTNIGALLQRMDEAARPQPSITGDDEPHFSDFLPRVDFYLFRSRCRDLLTPSDFAVVDDLYCKVFSEVRAHPYVSSENASERLSDGLRDTNSPGRALTHVRAAQAAMFTHGLLLKVNLDFFLNGVADGEHRRLTLGQIRSLRAYRQPWRSCAVVLRDADLTNEQIRTLRMDQVTDDGDLTADLNHLPLTGDARLFLRCQRILRTIHGATDSDPLLDTSASRIQAAQRRSSTDLNLPRVPTREPNKTSRKHRWNYDLGTSLLPLTTQHLPSPESIRNGAHA